MGELECVPGKATANHLQSHIAAISKDATDIAVAVLFVTGDMDLLSHQQGFQLSAGHLPIGLCSLRCVAARKAYDDHSLFRCLEAKSIAIMVLDVRAVGRECLIGFCMAHAIACDQAEKTCYQALPAMSKG